MGKDNFDQKMIEIESRSYEVSMMMAGFVFEILETFSGLKCDIYCEIPYLDIMAGYKSVAADSISVDPENGIISLTADGVSGPVMWDELNIAAKEIIISELHHKYKSLQLYKNMTVREEIH